MKLVSVFDSYDLPDEEMRELVCDEMGNGSFKRVYLDDGEWDEESDQPLDTLAKVAQWVKDQGPHVEKGDLYPYVLFSISW